MKRLILILLFLFFSLVLSAGGALVLLPDKALQLSVAQIPMLGGYTEQISRLKIDLRNILNFSTSPNSSGRFSFAGITISYSTPKISIDLVPLRKTFTNKIANNQPKLKDQSPKQVGGDTPTAKVPPMPLEPDVSVSEKDNGTKPPGFPSETREEQETQSRVDNVVTKSKPSLSETKTSSIPASPVKDPQPSLKTPKQTMTTSDPPNSRKSLKSKNNTKEKAKKKENLIEEDKLAINRSTKEKINPPPPLPKTTDGKKEHKLGLSYYKGEGVEKDFALAQKWFLEAAKSGHASAQYNLGIMSYLGQGVDKDFNKAAEWFRVAANQDHALAQYNLGFLYFEGKGVKKDNLQAFMWIDRAASQGDKKAIKALETLEKVLPKDIYKKK